MSSSINVSLLDTDRDDLVYSLSVLCFSLNATNKFRHALQTSWHIIIYLLWFGNLQNDFSHRRLELEVIEQTSSLPRTDSRSESYQEDEPGVVEAETTFLVQEEKGDG